MLQDHELARGTLRLSGVRPNKSIRGRLTIRLDPERVRALRKQQVGGKAALTLRGEITAPVPGQSAPLRVSFSLVRPVSLGNGGLQIKQLQLKEIGTDHLSLALRLRVQGISLGPGTQARITYKVAAAGTEVLTGIAALKANSKDVLLPMRISTAKLKAIKKAHKGRKIPFKISGRVAGTRSGEGGLKFDFPFTVSKAVALQEKPFEVKLHWIRLVRLKGGTRTIHVGLDVINRSGRPIKDLVVEGNVTLAPGVEVEVRNRSLTLLPGKSTRLNLLVKARRFALLKLLGSLIRKGKATGRMRLRFRGKSTDGTTITSRLEREATAPVQR